MWHDHPHQRRFPQCLPAVDQKRKKPDVAGVNVAQVDVEEIVARHGIGLDVTEVVELEVKNRVGRIRFQCAEALIANTGKR